MALSKIKGLSLRYIFAAGEAHPPHGELGPVITSLVIKLVQHISDMVVAIVAANIMHSFFVNPI